MDERRDLVDREELRRELNLLVDERHHLPAWNEAVGIALGALDDADAVECPRGWTRDEVLAELDADPDAVCEVQNPLIGEWGRVSRHSVSRWHPEVRRYDVRVVRVAPEPEWVPLTQLVGRTIAGETEPVAGRTVSNKVDVWWSQSVKRFRPIPVNLETGQVAVRPEEVK